MLTPSWLHGSLRLALPAAWMALAACGGKVEDVSRHAPGGSSPSPTPSASGPSSTPGGSTSSSTPGCRSASDCPGSEDPGAICTGPISPASLCARFPSCSSNAECTADGDVCSTGAGAQAADGGPACRPPCTSGADCNYWESCQPDGTCQPLSCDRCPSYLTCSNGACGPKACEKDSECSGGYCVDETCYGTLGTCSPGCG
jgi:hypothetical protein